MWFFNRAVRVLRVLKNSLQYADVTEVGDNYVRIDIPGIRWAAKPGYVGYVGFPILHPLRPWENHPFSINSCALFRRYKHTLALTSSNDSPSDSSHAGGNFADDKAPATPDTRDVTDSATTAGVFFIKKRTGMTKMLSRNARLLTILDGPYPPSASTYALDIDHLSLIGGGVGITGLLGWIPVHTNVKLAWSVKAQDQALVHEMNMAIGNVANKQVLVGQRFAISEILQKEIDSSYEKVGVVVCGPAEM